MIKHFDHSRTNVFTLFSAPGKPEAWVKLASIVSVIKGNWGSADQIVVDDAVSDYDIPLTGSERRFQQTLEVSGSPAQSQGPL